jgi:predicted ATPase
MDEFPVRARDGNRDMVRRVSQSRLTSVSVKGLRGLPGVEIGLQPMTALIGPRGVGKSRLLAAISWLLSGQPDLGGDSFRGEPSVVRASGLVVRAKLVSVNGKEREIERRPGGSASKDLPAATFLSARDRLPPFPEDAPVGWSDAAEAEQMVERIAESRLSGTEGEILIIEEPELMLTPHQQRHLYELLRRYAEKNQVIYSTRSPAMLDAAHHDEIVRLDRHADGVSALRAARQLLTDEQRVRLTAEFDHERNEMFFATAVVLVEGNTERLALPLIFRRLGYDPDALGISIVEVGGKGNLVLIARVLAELRIPHLIVFDSDRGRTGARESDYIRSHAGKAPVIELDPDFEGVAGIRSHEDKVFNAWQRFSDIDAGRIPGEFKEIAEKAVRLASGG